MQLVDDGMRTDALTQPLPAITCTSAPSVRVQSTLAGNATHLAGSRKLCSSVRWESCLRFVRKYIWANDLSQSTTTASFTETATLFPRPPPNELIDRQRLHVIECHPHLFCITTPIHINLLYDLLDSHPNRPLVKSMCDGLQHGFWPWAVTLGTDAPLIVDNAHLQRITNPGHQSFIETQ